MSTPSNEDFARAVKALAQMTPKALAQMNPNVTNAMLSQLTSAAAAARASSAAAAASSNPSTSLNASLPQYSVPPPVQPNASKYSQLLALIEELGKDIRPTYTGNRGCSERLKRGIAHARTLVRECQVEMDRNARQQSSNNTHH